MSRKSPLTDKQWKQIETRLLDGEAGCALAKEFGVSYNAIKKRYGSEVNQTKEVAKQIIATEQAFKALPVSSQINAVNLADKLRSISDHLAGAAENGAMTAHRLSLLANAEIQKIDDVDPLSSLEAVRGVSVLTKLANDSAEIGLNLLRANKETVTQPPRSIILNMTHDDLIAEAQKRGLPASIFKT
jgi:hypothetical protein